MKIVFLSNYYSHHQKPLCEEWYRLTDHGFYFVSTEQMTEERKQMGWSANNDVPFEIHCESLTPELESSIEAADVAILGNAPMSMLGNRLQQRKLVFKYSERVFKHGYNYLKWLPRLYTYRKLYGRYRSLYLLAASAYVSADFAMHGTFKGKCYKWGYFPEALTYDLPTLLAAKSPMRILWCARLINMKHPEAAIHIAERLKAAGYRFQLDMIGNGEMEAALREQIAQSPASDCIRLLGVMSPQDVRRHMEGAGIFLFTSDFGEGWGAVLNESMNSGCAVVASHAIGAAPYLVNHGQNGLLYQNGDLDDLYRKVKALLDHPERQRQLGEAAYHTITELWNARVAAERFLELSADIAATGRCDRFTEGPCSPAVVMKNNWFETDKHPIPWIDEHNIEC